MLSTVVVKKDVVRIINETQIITHAAEAGRPEVIERALSRIELIINEMRQDYEKRTSVL